MKRKCLLLVAVLAVVVPLSSHATGCFASCILQCTADNPCDPGDQACGDFVREHCTFECHSVCH